MVTCFILIVLVGKEIIITKPKCPICKRSVEIIEVLERNLSQGSASSVAGMLDKSLHISSLGGIRENREIGDMENIRLDQRRNGFVFH